MKVGGGTSRKIATVAPKVSHRSVQRLGKIARETRGARKRCSYQHCAREFGVAEQVIFFGCAAGCEARTARGLGSWLPACGQALDSGEPHQVARPHGWRLTHGVIFLHGLRAPTGRLCRPRHRLRRMLRTVLRPVGIGAKERLFATGLHRLQHGIEAEHRHATVL